MNAIWEVSFGYFLLVTVFLGGGAALLTGRAVAITWRPLWKLLLYVLLLTAAVRFIHYALFLGTLASAYYFLVDFIILLALASVGYRTTRAGQMVRQYSWIFERTGPVSWRQRQVPADESASAG